MFLAILSEIELFNEFGGENGTINLDSLVFLLRKVKFLTMG